jgi:hypothetical protein
MLDISIKALDKAITSKKKAADFIRKRVNVVEKIDGTKLTLIRNDEPFDPDDYTKNWIVSYKGRIIYPTEFKGLEARDQEIKASAIGTSQYKFVHDHLRKVHSGTAGVPLDTEFFIEFVQNKPTVTRDYGSKHGLFLVGFGSTGHATSRGHIYSAASFEGDPGLMRKYSSMLQLGEFPVIFEGNFSSSDEILKGCLDPKIKGMFQDGFADTDFSDPLSIVSLVVSVFSKLQSSLGGAAEGVVIQVGDDDISSQELYKVLAADQHSKDVRGQKKARFRAATEDEEEAYKSEVSKISQELVKQIPEGNLEDMFAELSQLAYGMKEVPFHPVKTKINVQEDIFLMAKLGILYAGTNEAQSVAIIPMAAKPFHKGHDSLISQAIADGNDAVIVFLSMGGREGISSKDMVPLWGKVYLPGLKRTYGNKVSIMFSDSPMTDAMKFARNFAREADKDVAIYGGIGEDGTNEAQSRVDMVLSKNPELVSKITAIGVERSATGGVSGTTMRGFLDSGDRASFINNLPDWLEKDESDLIWRSLSKQAGVLEFLIRDLVRGVLYN